MTQDEKQALKTGSSIIYNGLGIILSLIKLAVAVGIFMWGPWVGFEKTVIILLVLGL